MTDGERSEYWKGAYDRMSARSIEDGARIAALEAENADLSKALEPFALVYEKDISLDEADAETFQVMRGHNRAPKLTVGDFRRAYEARKALEPSHA